MISSEVWYVYIYNILSCLFLSDTGWWCQPEFPVSLHGPSKIIIPGSISHDPCLQAHFNGLCLQSKTHFVEFVSHIGQLPKIGTKHWDAHPCIINSSRVIPQTSALWRRREPPRREEHHPKSSVPIWESWNPWNVCSILWYTNIAMENHPVSR